ncbi:MAG: VWA domain-containing protein [Thermoplasmatales archaeon]|nr:MAG: VWA domain-containing protein [Thermoplasmatales archaeon]
MTYDAEISRRNPGLFIFLLDQSRSMSRKIAGGQRSKAQEASDAINRQLNEVISRCTKSDGIRPYFDVGVIGYGFKSGDARGLIGDSPVSISELESHILKMEKHSEEIDGETIETEFPVWFEPVASYDTPMVKALTIAKEWTEKWIGEHGNSFPPVIINISDGGATDGNPSDIAEEIMNMETSDGKVLLWNCHLSEKDEKPISFPKDETEIPEDKNARTMFSMTSVVPEPMVARAKEEFSNVESGSKAYVFNANLEELIKLLDIGTRVVYNKVE